MSRLDNIFMAVVGAFLFALPTQAQNVADTLPAAPEAVQPSGRSRICFRGRVLSSCKTFFITEVAYHVQEDSDGRGSIGYLSWTYGLMVNATDRDAIGATHIGIGLDNGRQSSGRDAWLLRYRRWIVGQGVAFDLSLGLASTADADPVQWRYIADLGMTIGDNFGAFGHTFGSAEGPQPSVGFKFGSWPGLILGIATSFLYQLGAGS